MYVKERILHENRTLHLHTMYKRHRAGVKGMETVTQPSQQIKEIEGKYGAIKVFQSQREVSKTDEDIHSLIARVLLMKQKRLANNG
ncbi:hypothetical protein HPK02_13815 [Anoxybacillus flavithermus]|uniref:hypothetical protein n=1 Tax=Anoxybacillus TaxID=150247 RepID=UPI0018695F2A|nr:MULTISPECIES: hypothetical protein [Anoxybacillus]MBE2914164.1 hypothetical protein [Anoxybacillus flavithermus]MBE2919855.1 hypothetical protein [Anoxybacillus flavithermus]MCL6585084.1 hypothetical protein [Anoxybacillus sp.]